MWKILIFSISTAKLMQTMPKHIFWPIIDCSHSLYACYQSIRAVKVPFYAESVDRGRGHFRSHDKDAGPNLRKICVGRFFSLPFLPLSSPFLPSPFLPFPSLLGPFFPFPSSNPVLPPRPPLPSLSPAKRSP